MKSILLLVCFLSTYTAFARHGKGGSIVYEYLGTGAAAGTSKYRITVKHYIDCAGTQFIEAYSYVGIFDAGTNSIISTLTIPETNRTTIQKKDFNPCINQPPTVCYVVVTYIMETELPDIYAGYILAEQECCRIDGIINIQSSSTYGITNTNTIPGVINGISYHTNSSPVFAQKDTVVICHDSYFSLDFSATDKDGDVLKYDFSSAKTGGTAQVRQPVPPTPPPYNDLPYQNGYNALQPLGKGVIIDHNTGMISGTAPSTLGSYIISVNVSEYRNNILIGLSKKEVQVTVADCSLAAALLKPSYNNCDSATFQFQNLSFSTNVSEYSWDFGVPGIITDISTLPQPMYTYADTGRYVLKLRVTSVAGCEDSTTAIVLVYPGFKSNFSTTGSCFQSPFVFKDASYAKYGTINNWLWNFGDSYSSANTSILSNPSHMYGTTGDYKVTLIAESSKGCVDTASTSIVVSNKPSLSVAFKDTLICSVDTLTLYANGNGIFSWVPNTNIINVNTASPFVFPKITTRYIVRLDENGCVAQDTVTVRVLDHITVILPPDTSICKNDGFLLRPTSDALQYRWFPALGLDNALIKNPTAMPVADIKYQVTANLGKCVATASIAVRIVPYPQAAAGKDTTICFGTFAQLNAVINGSSYTWQPGGSLQGSNSLSPVAKPVQSTSYVLSVYDTLGCPKPFKDTVVVFVLSPVNAFAGNDTSIVAGQPLQLHATGGTDYLWSPATFLNNPAIQDPIAVVIGPTSAVTYMVRVSIGLCTAGDAINIRIFQTAADIFVPSAFTPNGDGKNDVLAPILAGIKTLETFKVFNRWGQQVYSTNKPGEGWDGNLNAVPQQPGTFVYLVIGTSYLGEKIVRKGTAILIR